MFVLRLEEGDAPAGYLASRESRHPAKSLTGIAQAYKSLLDVVGVP
jgi:hypothetical protein